MDKLKIGLLCNGLGIRMRGSERFAVEFYKHMSDRFNIDLLGVKDTLTKTRDQMRLPWRNGKAYMESYLFGKHLYKYDMLKDYDLIINNSGFPCSYWCSKNRKKHDIPYISRARGGGREEYLSRLYKPNLMVFLTIQHLKQIAGANTNALVIPNAVDVSKYRDHVVTDSVTDGMERPVFLSTSAMVAFKRNHLIIQAVKKLGFGSLVMTSSGNLFDETKNLGKELLGKRFKTTGVIPDEQVLDLYKSCDVFVNASRKEGFGVVFLEAMSSGLSVVTQRDSRRKKIIGDAGLLIQCDNIESFAEALRYSWEEDWGDIPVEQAEKYDWEKIGILWFKHIKKIVEG